MKMLNSFKFIILRSLFFSGGSNSKLSVLIIFLSLCQMLSHASAPLNHSSLAFHLFRCVEDISEGSSCHSISIQALFEGVISFKSFNSTGATSLLDHFNGVSFEWPRTHRSFPRFLPDSSYFPGAILKFLFEV